MALAQKGLNVPYAFNRKEIKDHGEGGQIVGSPLKGQVVMIDDVITAGTAYRESKAIIDQAGAQLSAVVVAMDRQECGSNKSLSALDSIREEAGISVHSLITFDDLVAYIKNNLQLKVHLSSMLAYHEQYGSHPQICNE